MRKFKNPMFVITIFAVLTLGVKLVNPAVGSASRSLLEPAVQQPGCTCTITDDPGDGFDPGGLGSFTVTCTQGSITIDAVDAGTGLQALSASNQINVTVNIPAFTPGTISPVVVTYSKINASLSSGFDLRANDSYHRILIRVECPAPTCTGCTRTQGYWKNHPENWPVQSLVIGGRTYTQQELLSILGQPVKGNGAISLAHQLIAALLNEAGGVCVPEASQRAITDAQALLSGCVIPPVGECKLKTSTTSALTTILDNYNNGRISGGPSHCED